MAGKHQHEKMQNRIKRIFFIDQKKEWTIVKEQKWYFLRKGNYNLELGAASQMLNIKTYASNARKFPKLSSWGTNGS